MLLHHCASLIINNMIIQMIMTMVQHHDYMPAMLLRHCASFLINNMIILVVQQHDYGQATPVTWLYLSEFLSYPPHRYGISYEYPVPWDIPLISHPMGYPTEILNLYQFNGTGLTPPQSHPISRYHTEPSYPTREISYTFPATIFS